MRNNMHGVFLASTIFLSVAHMYSLKEWEVPSVHQVPGEAQKCASCVEIPPTLARTGPPADVSMPEIQLMSERSGIVVATRHWFDGKRSQYRVTESSDGGLHWIDLAILREGSATLRLIYAVGSGKAQMFLTQDYQTGSIERSVNSGRSWERLKFNINGQSSSQWIQTLDSTPGAELVPHLAAISPKDSSTLYATFQLWVPERGKSSGFGSWRDIPGMYVSQDGGDNWSVFSQELETGSPLGIGGEDLNVFIGMRKDGLVESHDGGHSWTSMGAQASFKQTVEIRGRRAKLAELKARGDRVPNEALGSSIRIDQIELSPGAKPTIYLRTNVGLVISRDGGRTWCVAGQGNEVFNEINGLSLSKTKPNELLISTTATAKSRSRILRSTDGGCTFKVVYTMGLNSVSQHR